MLPARLAWLVRGFVAAAGLMPWALALLGVGSNPATALFRALCHQEPARTLVLAGTPMLVCSRCAGLYLGAALGALLFLPARWLRHGRALLLGAALVMVVAVAVQDVGHTSPWHPLRLASGLLLGWAASGFMFATIAPRRAARSAISGPLLLVLLLLLLLALLSACSRASSAGPVGPGPSAIAASAAPSTAASAAGACDAEMPCAVLASPETAFARVLAENPRVLAVGETHAQKDVEDVPSATKRFTDALLPATRGKASDIVIELWVGNPACVKKVEKVQKQQKDVTATQAPTNQNEFMVLGDVAKKLGVMPHALVPGCDEYERILDAGGGDVDAMLSMIARLTARDVGVLLDKSAADAGAERMIVAYGGAMHNDAAPRPGHEAWSFGPALVGRTGGRYVELDLIVPELVKDTDAWRAQPWYPHYRADKHAGETLLFTTGPRSFALIFPRTPRP